MKKQIDKWEGLKKKSEELLDIAKITKEKDKEMVKELESNIRKLKGELDDIEFYTLFRGKYDNKPAILTIYSGSGGVDAQDWADMLLRMYLKFAEKQGFEVKILDKTQGDEAGIKNASLEIKGEYAFGYLKSESGVHRLVRLSPFDADNARHTSFALVDIVPEIEQKDYSLDEKDLKIDTFKASGHGGQSVNTTESAVRIKHIPTGITVNCQNERSQLQNKQQALNVLASKLQDIEEKEKKKEISDIRGESISAEWGNQIRSYVIHPYNMVKDHRSKYETSDVQKVLDGDINPFIEEYLKQNIAS